MQEKVKNSYITKGNILSLMAAYMVAMPIRYRSR